MIKEKIEMKEWILFDADNTLFDFTKSSKVSFKKTLDYFDIKREEDLKPVFNHVNEICWIALENKQMTAVELRWRRFEMFFKAIGEYRDSKEAGAYYLKCLSETDFLLHGALELLKRLRKNGFKMAIITNGLKEVQRPKFDASNLTPHFDEIVVSDEIGHAKPHKEFFDYTFKQIKNPPKNKTMVVGDSLNSDIRGGNNFGLETCWFNPAQKQNLTEIEPTHEIKALGDLISILT
jgi:2-haloacid dehalogenase